MRSARRVIDGIERVIGVRAAGQIFGEVPILFGTTFRARYRATEPTRVASPPPSQL